MEETYSDVYPAREKKAAVQRDERVDGVPASDQATADYLPEHTETPHETAHRRAEELEADYQASKVVTGERATLIPKGNRLPGGDFDSQTEKPTIAGTIGQAGQPKKAA